MISSGGYLPIPNGTFGRGARLSRYLVLKREYLFGEYIAGD